MRSYSLSGNSSRIKHKRSTFSLPLIQDDALIRDGSVFDISERRLEIRPTTSLFESLQ